MASRILVPFLVLLSLATATVSGTLWTEPIHRKHFDQAVQLVFGKDTEVFNPDAQEADALFLLVGMIEADLDQSQSLDKEEFGKFLDAMHPGLDPNNQASAFADVRDAGCECVRIGLQSPDLNRWRIDYPEAAAIETLDEAYGLPEGDIFQLVLLRKKEQAFRNMRALGASKVRTETFRDASVKKIKGALAPAPKPGQTNWQFLKESGLLVDGVATREEDATYSLDTDEPRTVLYVVRDILKTADPKQALFGWAGDAGSPSRREYEGGLKLSFEKPGDHEVSTSIFQTGKSSGPSGTADKAYRTGLMLSRTNTHGDRSWLRSVRWQAGFSFDRALDGDNKDLAKRGETRKRSYFVEFEPRLAFGKKRDGSPLFATTQFRAIDGGRGRLFALTRLRFGFEKNDAYRAPGGPSALDHDFFKTSLEVGLHSDRFRLIYEITNRSATDDSKVDRTYEAVDFNWYLTADQRLSLLGTYSQGHDGLSPDKEEKFTAGFGFRF